MRMQSPPAGFLQRSPSAMDVASSIGTGADAEMKSRVKLPAYWLRIITVEAAFCGKTFLREFDWAEACIDRERRKGRGMDAEDLFVRL